MDLHRWAKGSILSAAAIALILVFIAAWLFFSSKPKRVDAPPEQGLEDFIEAHWQRPIPLQGDPPASFSKIEASLAPEACGECHARQYADWKESLHSKAMGPGPWGQIIDSVKNDPANATLCMTCHAPLGEQNPFLAKSGNEGEKFAENPHFDPALQLKGITCAACHVRHYLRYGPPKAEGAAPYPASMANHGGAQRTPYFERAEFCRDCHQFDPENTVLINGKPIQDTYREWKESSWGQGGAACQECHMPQRRHLWKGIHDAEWVRGGVRFKAKLEKGSSETQVTLEVISAAVGHKFPSYVTPKVFVRAALLDEKGEMLPGSQKEAVIGWDARFENGQWVEYFDTRIPPGGKFQHSFRWPRSDRARGVRAWLEVDPDHFYRVHFYPAYLNSPNLSAEGRQLIEKALEESSRSSYILFEQRLPLN